MIEQGDATAAIDHRALLVKYIAHVINAEGIDFIHDGTWYGPSLFTMVEWDELCRLAGEGEALFKATY